LISIRSSDNEITITQWGAGYLNDIPLINDYDGDGKSDFAVWRPGELSYFHLNRSTEGGVITQWGEAGDIPLNRR
jgi:hypothetical protein